MIENKKSIISKSLLIQSTPSLLFSLVSLALAGKWLDTSMNNPLYKDYPLMLISSCILSFKGNIELILAMNLSTMSQSRNMSTHKFLRYAFDNSCLVITQSVIIGTLVGVLGALKNILSKNPQVSIVTKVISSVMVSCFFSSIFILLIMIAAIKLAGVFGIDPDNIILPGISAFGDYFGIRSCIYFIRYFNYTSLNKTILISSIILSLTLIPFYISMTSKRRIPQQTVEILVLTYLLSTSAGYILDFFSKDFKILAIFEPVFCGMCCSTAFIYLNKRVTALENGVHLNNRKIFFTLLLAAFTISSFYLICLFLFLKKFIFSFSVIFVFFFVMNVFILLYFIQTVIDRSQISNPNIGIFAIPLISSLSDIIGVVTSVIVVVIVSFLQK